MPVRIGLGLLDYPFSGAAAYWRWVDLCESGGVDSLWQSDRLAGATPFLECMSVMGALAGRTRRLKFGMSVLSMAFREPLIVAKECATIDYLSNGRMLPAFGIGNPSSPDWAAVGMTSEGHGGKMNQALDIMARLWRGETVTTDGPHYRYRDARISPLPVQNPLPLWIGGSSPAAIRRTARLGTGWLAGAETHETIAPVVAAIKAEAEAVGRPMDPEHFGAGFFFRFGDPDDPIVEARRANYRRAFPNRDFSKVMVVGGADDIIERVRAYVAAGVTKFVLRPLAQDDEDILDQTRKLIEQVLPVIHVPKKAAAA